MRNDELDERRARALVRANNTQWKLLPVIMQSDALASARAIRASDEAAGMVLVPRELSPAMLNAGREKIFGEHARQTSEVWDAMISASQEKPE